MTTYIIRVGRRFAAVRVAATRIEVDLTEAARKRTGCHTWTSGGTGDQSIQRVARDRDTLKYPSIKALREECSTGDVVRVRRLDT
jgi:hypothetical protein